LLKVEGKCPKEHKANVAAFKEKVKEITNDYEGISVAVSCPANVGDDYTLIEDVTTIDDATNFTAINHNEGEVLMIDFWATWCPPCQKPMQHNSEMVAQHGEAWGGKVRIIGVSIDKDAPTVQAHVQNKGWGNVEHYHKAKSSC